MEDLGVAAIAASGGGGGGGLVVLFSKVNDIELVVNVSGGNRCYWNNWVRWVFRSCECNSTEKEEVDFVEKAF